MTPAEAVAAIERLVRDDVVEMLTDLGEMHGYGVMRPEDPRDFTPDAEECTPEEIANHRAAVEAVERGEPVPDQPFTPDAVTYVNGEAVHMCGGPWGIGSYVVRDPVVLEIRDAVLAARPALSALAGMCVLDVEVVRALVAASGAALDDLGWEHCVQHGVGPDVVAALAAAEAELRRVDVRDV